MKLSSFPDTPFLVQLSFYQIVENLEKIAAGLEGERQAAAQALLEEVYTCPELTEGITDISQTQQNAGLISRLLAGYFPQDLTLNEIKAVGIPFKNIIFNHTERFKNILKAAGPGFEINIRDFDTHQSYILSCCIILNEVYGTNLDFGKPLFYDIPTASGITKHYRILYNADFLDIVPTERAVSLSQDDIDQLLNSYDDLALWKEKFPEESWILKGFAIMTLFDATVENAVSIFKEKLLVLNSVNFQQSITSIFQSIFQIPDLKIGFTVFNQEEHKLSVAAMAQRMQSFILPDDAEKADKEVLCIDSYRSLIKERNYFAVSNTAEFQRANPESRLAGHFLDQNIQSFILAPVVKNGVLFGILEVVSGRAKVLNSIHANKLDVVMPFLTDTMERLVAELQNKVQAFIQDKYTAIHASVYWKFRTEAQRFLYDLELGKDPVLEEIVFAEVYPLYGQIDIKGSSEARNLSVQNDLQKQLKALSAVLKRLHQVYGAGSFGEEEQQLAYFLTELALPPKAGTEQHISNYIKDKVHIRLKQMADPALLPVLNQYFAENDKDKGDFHVYRRKYETTIGTINEKMAAIIDERQAEAQALFPHYYERFKTDGVEHNLYIGASISASRQFNMEKLYGLRMWQIRVLCEMETAHYHLKQSLPYPLEVATLILVYNITIAIRFRMDEKRFDVDGSYNARFEIVKKRIDKAHIKDTDERITAAGKITIVYTTAAEEQEYNQYIKTLQSAGLLASQLENFDIEDLQGVSGLKALRATIIH